jgi:hypothetical protein
MFEFGWREREENGVMTIGEMEIYDYARQLLGAHGDMAVIEAAQKACDCEEKGEGEEAEPGGTSRRP